MIVVLDASVEDGIGHLVAELVRVALVDGLGSEEEGRHVINLLGCERVGPGPCEDGVRGIIEKWGRFGSHFERICVGSSVDICIRVNNTLSQHHNQH